MSYFAFVDPTVEPSDRAGFRSSYFNFGEVLESTILWVARRRRGAGGRTHGGPAPGTLAWGTIGSFCMRPGGG